MNKLVSKILIIAIIALCLKINNVNAAEIEITSDYGWRIHPITGEWKFHTGIDFAYDYGDPIVAMLPGTVVYCAEYGGYGNTVIIQHNENTFTLYGHCNNFYCYYGQAVDKGTVIAAAGSTGYSTGPHLHLELWQEGEYANPIILWRSTLNYE